MNITIKTKKLKNTLYLFIILLLFNLLFMNTFTYAIPKDVTNTISNKQDIKELVQIFTTPCGYHLTELMQKGRTKIFNFSKSIDRKSILDFCYEEIYDKAINEYTLTMRMFGKPTSNIDMLIGDWGESGPEIKIKSIYKTSATKYKIVSNINWINVSNHTAKKLGTMRLYLKNDSNSYYGYIVKSMKLKKVNDI